MSQLELTKRQMEILEFLKNFISEKGFPPTVREIGKAVGLSSTASVYFQLKALEDKGYIKRDPAKNRCIEIISDEYKNAFSNAFNIPVVGTVTAGSPILAVENITGHFPLSSDYFGEKASFMLRVKGESMINAHIADGDIVIVEKTSYAENGDIVVALLEDSATVKRFYKEKDHIRLQPENDNMEPIISDNVEIIGKVIGLFRIIS